MRKSVRERSIPLEPSECDKIKVGDLVLYYRTFWKHLLQRNLNQDWLKGVHYAIFGLVLQFVAKKLDNRVSDLGAVAIIERGLGDDQHPSG
ncbi:hypothetical protein AgCh_028735 [Apium graveolens]